MVDLTDRRILIVEDEYVIALDLASTFERKGARVIGPAATLAKAFELVADAQRIDAAVLDISLRDELVFPLADVLKTRSVPYVFTTGCDDAIVPWPHRDASRHEKPIDADAVARALFR